MQKQLKILVLIFLLGLNTIEVKAQKKIADIQLLHNTILNLDFNQYETLKNSTPNKDKDLLYWLDGYKCFIEYKTTHKAFDKDSVLTQINFCYERIKNSDNKSIYYYYTQADLQLFLSFIYFESNKSIASLNHYLKANSLIKKQQELYPEFKFAAKHKLLQFFVHSMLNQQLGIFEQPVEQIQENFTKLISNSGSTEDTVFHRELKLLGILLFNFQFNSNPERFSNDLKIDTHYASKGPLESILSAMWAKKTSNYAELNTILSTAIKQGYERKINLLNLYYGNTLLNQRKDSSIFFIHAFLNNQENNYWKSYANYKALTYWYYKKDYKKYDSIALSINIQTNQVTPDDKQALYELKNRNFWTPELINARLMFDGGNYNSALKVLLENKHKVQYYQIEQKLEYSYRIARIYHKLNELDNAERFYVMAINSNLDKQFYYPAYAAFYLGTIYQSKNNINEANKFFAKCVELDSPIYKSSIHSQANNAMNTYH